MAVNFIKIIIKASVELLVVLIKTYKLFISPLLPANCRFYPSCSSYSIEALKKHGLFIGLILAVKRILKCNPFFYGGYDPVPDTYKLW
jgi:hypothetical protein